MYSKQIAASMTHGSIYIIRCVHHLLCWTNEPSAVYIIRCVGPIKHPGVLPQGMEPSHAATAIKGQQQQMQQQQQDHIQALPSDIPAAFELILNPDMEPVDDVSSTSSEEEDDEL